MGWYWRLVFIDVCLVCAKQSGSYIDERQIGVKVKEEIDV